jgi:hypothetical protein
VVAKCQIRNYSGTKKEKKKLSCAGKRNVFASSVWCPKLCCQKYWLELPLKGKIFVYENHISQLMRKYFEWNFCEKDQTKAFSSL